MIKVIVIFILLILTPIYSNAQNKLDYTIFVKQTGSYYISDRVTSGGMGMGIGAQIEAWKNFASQFECNILWGDGNAAYTGLAAGYQLNNKWSPAFFFTAGFFWGQRLEVLSVDGRRPVSPVWVLGLRITPIRFELESGFVSALEIGYGIGPDEGSNIEISILSVGIKI